MMKTSKAYVEFKKIEGIFLLGRSGAWKSRKDNYVGGCVRVQRIEYVLC